MASDGNRPLVLPLVLAIFAFACGGAHARTICSVTKEGTDMIVHSCEDGYVCSNDRCIPDPSARGKAPKSSSGASQDPNSTRGQAITQARKDVAANLMKSGATRRADEAKIYGSTSPNCIYGCTHYKWNGDPKVIPSPRTRQGSSSLGPPRQAARRTPAQPRQPGATWSAPRVSPVAPAINLLGHLASAIQNMQPGDPTRPAAVAALRDVAKKAGLPEKTVDDLVCGRRRESTGRKLELRWRLADIPEAIERSGVCAGISDPEELEACSKVNVGRAIMWAEPEIGGLCRALPDASDQAECAKNKFLNAYARGSPAFIELPRSSSSAQPCTAESQSGPSPRRDTSLRDQLKKRLHEGDNDQDQAGPADGAADDQSAGSRTAQGNDTSHPRKEEDEIWCNFIGNDFRRGALDANSANRIPDVCGPENAAAKERAGIAGLPLSSVDNAETERQIVEIHKNWAHGAEKEQERLKSGGPPLHVTPTDQLR